MKVSISSSKCQELFIKQNKIFHKQILNRNLRLTAQQKYRLYQFKVENPNISFAEMSKKFSITFQARVELHLYILQSRKWDFFSASNLLKLI